MPIELKPCPFCGGEVYLHTYGSYNGYLWNCVMYNLSCAECGATISTKSLDHVVELWNRRATDET